MQEAIETKPNLLSVEQVAIMLNVSVMTVRRLIEARKIKASKIGRQWRIKETEIDLLIERTST